MQDALVHVYFGNGKGKTTAAVGLATRASGNGLNVLFAQFLKDNKSSERKSLAKLKNITLLDAPDSIKFYVYMSETEKKQASDLSMDIFNKAKQILADKHIDIVIFDEILAALECELIDLDTILEFIKNRPKTLEVILTGRNCPNEILALSDYTSEIKCIKHPFDSGHKARAGIEF